MQGDKPFDIPSLARLPRIGGPTIKRRGGIEVVRGPFAVPGPGEICPLCGETTPKLDALRMRAWRKRRKSKTHGTGEKLND